MREPAAARLVTLRPRCYRTFSHTWAFCPYLWERDRARFVRDLGLPRSCEAFLQHLEAALTAGLEAVAEAVADGAMTIDKSMIVLPKTKPAPEDPRLDQARHALIRAIGDAVVPHDLAREAGEDRRQDRAARAVRGLPARRGGGAAGALRRDPAPDRPLARTAHGSGLTGADHGAASVEGRPCAEGRRDPPGDPKQTHEAAPTFHDARDRTSGGPSG